MTTPPSLPDDPALRLRGLLERGRFQETLEEYQRLSAEPLRPDAQLLAATAATRLGNLSLAASLAETALAGFRARADDDGRMRATNLLGVLAFERGRPSEAEGHFHVALDLARALGDSMMTARACNNLASLADLRGDPEEALSLYRYALLSYQRLGDRRGTAESYHNLGIVFRQMEAWGDAESSATEAVRHAELVGERSLVAIAVTGRAEVELYRGEASMARQGLVRAEALARDAGDELGLVEVGRLRALLELAQGQYEAAVTQAVESRTVAERARAVLLQAECAAAAARALKALGRVEEAERYRTEAIGVFESLGAKRRLEELEKAWKA